MISSGGSIRFGPFELDVRSAELRKGGTRVRLPDQPFYLLVMLLERPGDLISREQIRSKLWPGNTVVEFDHSINAAVKRLRNALGDSAEQPRYIETLPRRGYRFIGELEAADPSLVAAPVAVIPENGFSIQKAEPAPWRRALPLGSRILVPVLLATVILTVWAGAWYYRREPRPLVRILQPLMRLDLDVGTDASPSSDHGANVILSPDGSRLVYVSHSKLFTRRLDQSAAAELPGTDGAQTPFFSPDGQWVGFFTGSMLKKVSLQKGQVIPLCAAGLNYGGSWGEDGSIIAAFDFRISRIPSAGGTPTRVTEPASGEISHRWPQILPGGKAILFSAYRSMTGLDGATIEALSLRDGNRKTLVRGGSWGRYLTSGHLVYLNEGTLFALPFDPDRLELHGIPVPVLQEVAYNAAWGSAQVDFSQTGSLVYRSSKAGSGLVTVEWLDDSGNTRPLLPVPGNYLSPTLSPDGSRLALTSSGDIWVYELGRGSMTRLTYGGGYGNPLWTADGRYIVFRAAQGMLWVRADGTARPQVLTQSENQQTPWSFTRDGKRLAFGELTSAARHPGSQSADIWTVLVETGSSGLRAGKPEVFLQTRFSERHPMFSPDGRWIAYQSDESGRQQVYVQAFPDKHGKRQISGDRGTYPAWSPNGHELFFWRGNQGKEQGPQLMVTEYKVRGDSLIADQPRLWSEKRLIGFTTTRTYDPAPDGKQVVALTPADAPQELPGHVIFLLNFFDELRRRVPLSAN